MNLRTLVSAAAIAVLAALPPGLAAAPLALADLPALVLANDASAVMAARSVEAAYHGYRGTVADALPQVDASTRYTGFGNSVTEYDKHDVAVALSLSQLLPTAGSLTASAEGAIGVERIPPLLPDADFTVKPKASISLTQPVLLNGKLVDLELFPATKRKAELGWEKEQAAERVAANRTLAGAVQIYLSTVQLRQAVAQLERAVQLSQRRLASLAENVRLGIATDTDVLDARIANGRQRQTLLDLRSSLTRTERLLAAAIGRESLGGLELSDGIPSWTRAGDPDGLRGAALSANASLAQAALSLEERAADEVIAGQRHAATLSLSFSVAGRRGAGLSQRTFGESFSDLFDTGAGVDWTASAGLNVPLYDGGSRREQEAVSAALTASVAEGLASRRRAVLDDLAAALERRGILEERVALLAEAVDLAGRRLSDERSLLGLGRSTDNDVDAWSLDAEAKRNDLWRARADLLLANLDVASLAGDELAGILEGLPR